MRNILHENTDAIATANASGFQIGRNAIHQPNDIRVSEFLGLIILVQYEGASVWFTLRPVLDAIEDPTPRNRAISRRTGNLGQWRHASVE